MNKLLQIWHDKELRNKIFLVLGLLVVFRIGSHIPVPGINAANLSGFLESNQLLGLINIFSGGNISNFSILALGVAPYITASIIIQLLTMIIPQLEELSKEGEYGQRKITMYTRWLTVPLAFLQSYGLINLLSRSAQHIFVNLTLSHMLVTMLTLTAGTLFLMWLGEIISEQKIGNGVSLLIFAGIIAGIPGRIQAAAVTFDSANILNLVLFLGIAVATIVGVVIITEAQRNIPVSYARQVRGMRVYGGFDSHLPLRLNMAGVIPIIFAISLILFPPLIGQFFQGARTVWIRTVATFVVNLFQNQIFYGVLYFFLVVGFTYFYTAIIFHPDKISESLQKQGGFIPGHRPGAPTAQYLLFVTNRIMLAGAMFLGAIAILPLIVQSFTGTRQLVIGGTSLLIVVSVVIEMVNQIEAQVTTREYEAY